MIGKRGFSKSMQLKDHGLNKKERGHKRKHDAELRAKENPICFNPDESGLWMVNPPSPETQIHDNITSKESSFDKESFLAEIREAIRVRKLNLGI